MSEIEQKWDTVIEPKTGLFRLDLKEIWKFRDLFSLFVKRDIITQYKQTVLGPLWFIIQPILTTIMQVVIFKGVAKMSTDGLPAILFYMSGNVFWGYFSECITKTSSTFNTNAAIFGKVYFPRMIAPLSTVASNLVRFAIQMALFIAFYIYFIATGTPISPNIYLLMFPLLVLMLAGLALGFGVIVSSMTTKYRDLAILFTFIVQLWQYATPVIYPMSFIENSTLKLAINLNPLTPIFEAFRYGALGVGSFSWWGLTYSFGFMIVVLLLGTMVFNRVQRSFMDTV
ncbi:MAG: ABC transporter permease [Prevotellaceae bacterium]|jgi:lipopolysaccharide transport system permease protein|nr:ABC transporter permease [Prevotellaceae bacterium]